VACIIDLFVIVNYETSFIVEKTFKVVHEAHNLIYNETFDLNRNIPMGPILNKKVKAIRYPCKGTTNDEAVIYYKGHNICLFCVQ